MKLLIPLIAIFAFGQTILGKNMAPQLLSKEQFQVIGIQTRTNNKAEMGPNGKIGKLWQRFYKENIFERIPNKTGSGDIFAVYTDYESDTNGDYTLLIGTSVSSASEVPEGLVAKTIPAQKYAKFSSGAGKIPGIIFETWKRIHSSSVDRAYTADFELHDGRTKDPNHAELDIFIAVKRLSP